MHRAETILQAVETALTGLATTGTNVQRARVRTVETPPALSIEMGSDDIAFDRSSYPRVERDLNVQVIAHVKNNTSIDSDLNQIRAEVYTALITDRTLGLTFVTDTESIGDDEPEITGEGEKVNARQQLNFVVKYRHSWSDAEA